MSNFFTDGRLALAAALRADEEIAACVKTWFDFGPGLTRRHNLEPAACPALSVAPADSAEGYVANVERESTQVLHVEVATDGQDVQPCEELTGRVLSCVEASNGTCLGLAAEGLTGLRVRTVRWAAVPREDGARLVWTAAVEVELLWRRV
jgi:hypothetical protein